MNTAMSSNENLSFSVDGIDNDMILPVKTKHPKGGN